MNVLRSLRAVSAADGPGVVDWDRAAAAAKASTEPGSIALTDAERNGYAEDVRDARARLREVAGVDFDVPDAIEVQNRHHWIDASVDTFRNVMAPLGLAATGRDDGSAVPAGAHTQGFARDLSRVANTGSMAFTLGFLARNVLGQYDPLLLADEPAVDHGLYFVHPNIVAAAASLDVDLPRFRRWIAFHEVTHAAEFGAAPWLSEYLESRVERGLEGFTDEESPAGGSIPVDALDTEPFAELQAAMTAVEGYAEVLMDRAFDGEYADLRRKLDARREGGGPVQRLARRLLGLGLKRRQYEQGAAFFRHVADARGIEGASAVWERPENLPTRAEIGDPEAWLVRVDPAL